MTLAPSSPGARASPLKKGDRHRLEPDFSRFLDAGRSQSPYSTGRNDVSRMLKRTTKTRLLERRREVANYALKGWTQAAIARHMNIPTTTVSRDLAVMREFWREFPIYDFRKARLEQLQKVDLVEAEAWAAWQRSQEPQRCASLSHGKTGEQSRSSLKHQFGDPRFLGEVTRCIAQRSSLIGLKPPEPPPPDVVNRPTLEEQHREAFAQYLRFRMYYGEPPFNRAAGLSAEQTALIVAEQNRIDPV